MQDWQLYFNKGIHYLKRKKIRCALDYLYKAVNACPVRRVKELRGMLYYLGICLKRIGFLSTAIKSWLASQKLKKRGFAYCFIRRYVNDYGMPRQAAPQQDDWMAFYSIQLKKYLSSKNKRTFSTEAERDMIRDLIGDYFTALEKGNSLQDKNAREKMEIFRKTGIVFPFIVLPQENESVIRVDFFRNRRVMLDDRCPCGSGLHYSVCCGRTPSEIELLNGYF